AGQSLAGYLPFELVTNQVEFSAERLDAMHDGTLDLALETGTTPLVTRPLAGGQLLTGEGVSPALLDTLDLLGRRKGVDRAVVALSFVLSHPSRPVVVVGTSEPDRVVANRAANTICLDHGDLYLIIDAAGGLGPR
ncbi:MAG: aldo/keto reductase, partial [Actinomycetota bacterium]